MAERLLDYDAYTRMRTYHDYDHDTRVTTIRETQDESYIVGSLTELKQSTPKNRVIAGSSHLNDYERAGIEREWYHVARISTIDQMKWREEGIDIYKINKCDWTKKKIYQKLNWSGKEKWRTGNGKI